MEQRNNLVLQGTETFSRGQLDNLALENGALVLDSVAGRSLLYGSYTTPEFAMPAFCNLNVSWNAHAPRDTMVEVRCRVYAAGAWTAWMSFGKWAPDYPRCSINAQSEDGAEMGLDAPTAKDKGKIMKNLMPKVKGKADGKLVNEIVSAFMN